MPEQSSALEPRDDTSAGVLVGRIVEADAEDTESRGRLLGRLASRLARSARAAGAASVAGGRWMADVFADDIAPRIPIRDAAALRAHHEGLDGEQLADALVRNAALGTTAVGAAGGALSAVQLSAPPLLLTTPALLSAETVTVAAIEIKLLAELHEVYGVPAPGGPMRRTSGYLSAWAHKRGLDLEHVAEPVSVVMGVAAKTALRNRLMRLMGRHLSTLGPFLTGAVAGGTFNRAGTRALAEAVRSDLRSRGALAVGPAPASTPELPPV